MWKLCKLINIILFAVITAKNANCDANGVYNKENILILVVDDLRPLLADWGDNLAQTPYINTLSKTSAIFKNAYAQQALCAPSRNSFLTGRRPDSLHLYDFYSYWRNEVGDFVTIPQFFKQNGYRTYSFGKVFHPGVSSNWTDDYPKSWSEYPYHPSSEKYKDSKVCFNERTNRLAKNIVCPVDVKLQPEQTLPDIQITEAVIDSLLVHHKFYKNVPFFIAVGFHKPHIPIKFPREYLKYFPLNKIPLPLDPFRPASMPTVAWNTWVDVKKRDDIKELNISFPFGAMPFECVRKVKQSYYAAVMYIDEQIGRILQHVDLNSTIVILTSDHGWSLGEHGEWAKYSNFDVALKLPLIIHAPGLTEKKMSINQIVELIDIFPTVIELTGIKKQIPICPENKSVQFCVEGFSLVPLMKKGIRNNKKLKWNHAAYSQYPRPGLYPSYHPNTDEPRLKDIKIMGYTIRTKRHRYTEWVDFNHTSCKANWSVVHAKELYDHSIDTDETLNLSNRMELQYLIKHLSAKLRGGWRLGLKV